MRRIMPILTNAVPARTPRVIRAAPPASLARLRTLRRAGARRGAADDAKVLLPIIRVEHAEAARRPAEVARARVVWRAVAVGVVGGDHRRGYEAR